MLSAFALPLDPRLSKPASRRREGSCRRRPRHGATVVVGAVHGTDLPFGLDAEELGKIVEDQLLGEEGGDQPELRPPVPLKVNVDLKFHHAKLALQRSHRDRARELFLQCVKMRPFDGRGWLGLARMDMREGNIQEARKIFRIGLHYCKRNAHLLQAWGVLEERNGNCIQARKLYNEALEADPRHAASWVALGLYEQRRNYDVDRARECFRTGTEAAPGSYYLWHVWGELEASQGNLQAARQYFQRGLQVNPNNAATYHSLGLLEYELGNERRAGELFTQALDANPKNVHVVVSLAVIKAKAGDTKAARQILRRGLETQRRDPVLYQMLGMLEITDRDFEKAQKWFERGLSVDRRHCPLWQAWGLMEARLGHTERARKIFQQGVWSNPKSDDIDRIWHAWGSCERRWGHIDCARLYFRYGLQANARSTPLLCSLARLEAEYGELPQARNLFEQAVRCDPTNSFIWRGYEAMETTFGDDVRAATILRRSLQAAKMDDRRLVLSEPQDGDFASTGAWITGDDLRVSMEKAAARELLDPADRILNDRIVNDLGDERPARTADAAANKNKPHPTSAAARSRVVSSSSGAKTPPKKETDMLQTKPLRAKSARRGDRAAGGDGPVGSGPDEGESIAQKPLFDLTEEEIIALPIDFRARKTRLNLDFD